MICPHREQCQLNAKGMSHQRRIQPYAQWAVLFLSAMLFLSSEICLAQKKQKLDKNFHDWLERDVAYIITKDEREAFLKLSTDQAREKFVETFWEIRNPFPGSPANSYKDEIYQRIAFADARFGIGSGLEGWRTDRGRTYITLGPPQQKQVFRNSANLYPIEIWFYGGANPALPPAFYVMFYQREGSGDYRFYSPYTDGPDKLATGIEAINSRSAALRMIRNSAGPELARIALTLLPDEPVDESSGIVSLQSDILLNSIKNLANLPSNREDILRRMTNREAVTSRLVLEGRNLDIVTLPTRDSRGLTRLDYAIRLHSPSDLGLAEEKDGRYSFSVEVRVRVFNNDNKLIFTQQKSLADSITRKRFDTVKDNVFGYQGTLPLPPGKYHLEFQFTDWSRKSAFQTVREVAIPVPAKDTLIVSGVVPFLSAENADPALADLSPFTIGGVHFTPLSTIVPSLVHGTSLEIVYQIWASALDPRENLGKKLYVQYAFGRPATPGSTTTVKDEISREQFDAGGSLVTGKKLSLENQTSGNYILSVAIHDPETKHSSFGTMNFKVLDAPPPFKPWDVLEPGLTEDAQKGIPDQQRALCYWSASEFDEARVWFRRALQFDRSNDVARARLVDAYFAKQDYAAVVSLFTDAGVTDATDSQTLLRIAASLGKGGDSTRAIALLERALLSRPEEGPIYLALARYYSEIGNSKKADELTQKGKTLLTEPPAPL
jgi:GWxTD domain-containing protein